MVLNHHLNIFEAEVEKFTIAMQLSWTNFFNQEWKNPPRMLAMAKNHHLNHDYDSFSPCLWQHFRKWRKKVPPSFKLSTLSIRKLHSSLRSHYRREKNQFPREESFHPPPPQTKTVNFDRVAPLSLVVSCFMAPPPDGAQKIRSTRLF